MQELFKGPTHKFSLTATYPGLWQRRGQTGLVMPEGRLEDASIGERTERVDSGILAAEAAIILRQTAQANLSSPRQQQPEGKQPPGGSLCPAPVVLKPDC